MSDPIPSQLWGIIKDFCAQGKTGQITLDAKAGRILSWKVTEWGRVDPSTIDNVFKK